MNGKEKSGLEYEKLFWLFMLGSVLGVFLEGIWCFAVHERWETHVVSVWGPFCIIYGVGAVGFYIGAKLLRRKSVFVRFAAFALIGSVIEMICGALLEYGLCMKAWDYSGNFLNFKGYVCLSMTLMWGIMGVAFSRFALKATDSMLGHLRGRCWKTACICLSVFMAINLMLTSFCIVRRKNRHFGVTPSNAVSVWIDEHYNDAKMENRFCEWRFIN